MFADHPYEDVAVQYEPDGRPSGTAVVLFKRFEDGMKLKREFAGVRLDGKHLNEFFPNFFVIRRLLCRIIVFTFSRRNSISFEMLLSSSSKRLKKLCTLFDMAVECTVWNTVAWYSQMYRLDGNT